MKTLLLAKTAAILALYGACSLAQDYPARTVTLVAPFAAGSPTDSAARIIGARLGERLKQALIVENKPGANAQIGAEYVARAKPDGYTLFFATSTSHSSNPSLFKTLRYDPVRDFTPIGRTVDLSYVLLVNPTLPAKTVRELIDYARANPGKLSYATPNSPSMVVAETMRVMSNLSIVGVPYKSGPQALTDLISGQVQLYVADLMSSVPAIRSGQARALGLSTVQGSKLVPGLPALADTFPGLDIVSWGGIFGPADLPRPVVARLSAELQAVLAEKDVQERLIKIGFEVSPSKSPEEFARYVVDQLSIWSRLVKQAGIQPE